MFFLFILARKIRLINYSLIGLSNFHGLLLLIKYSDYFIIIIISFLFLFHSRFFLKILSVHTFRSYLYLLLVNNYGKKRLSILKQKYFMYSLIFQSKNFTEEEIDSKEFSLNFIRKLIFDYQIFGNVFNYSLRKVMSIRRISYVLSCDH